MKGECLDPTEKQLRARFESVAARQRSTLDRQDLRRAAVLVPIVFRDGTPNFILTTRTMTVAHHKGQISFPGGVAQPSDQTSVDTALREANEEIGLDPECVQVVGLLDDLATITHFSVTPVLGFVSPDAAFTIEPREVDHMFEAPIGAFRDPDNYELVRTKYLAKPVTYHRYTIDGHVIWGATAKIINRFLDAYENLSIGE
jgi:8-oxo-dGTP pyrophosphatase MutT (NUDIX family)